MARRGRFFADEHVAKAVIVGLRQRGIDVRTVPETESMGASDLQHLECALADRRVIVTHDADILRLHSEGHAHAGIVYATQGRAAGELIRRLVLIAQVLDADDVVGHVEFA